jgi:hypothetical protein
MSEQLEWDKKRIILVVVIVLIIAATGAPSFYFYSRYKSAQNALKTAATSSSSEVKALVEKIGQHILLPDGEDPTVATISDIEKLKNQPFFAHAKNGDKVLVYAKAKKAFLYDTIAEKVIEVGPIVVPTPSTDVLGDSVASISASTNDKRAEPLTVALYNGTQTENMTLSVSLQLKAKDPTIQVVDRENAQKNTYTKTQVLNINPSKKDQLERLAKLLSAEIVATVSGEKIPTSSDFLVIIGSDKVGTATTPTTLPSPTTAPKLP